MAKIEIDLISDTSTRPSSEILHAMCKAETGDEQRGEDPTTRELCEKVAGLLGMEDAVFLPSGTMCNQIAFLVHCRPGDEIIAAENAHIVQSEGAGAAVLAGTQFRTIRTDSGIFAAKDVEPFLRTPRDRSPVSRLVSVEQTTNSGGGAIWPRDTLKNLVEWAKENGLMLHMDGARLLNAVVASGIPASEICAGFDSAWIDLSKGLGCPVGAVLAGSSELIRRAWVWKHRLGGAMRQSGVLAAAGIFALDNNVQRMAQDHANAQYLADKLRDIPGLRISPDRIETNILFLDVSGCGKTTAEINEVLCRSGIRLDAESMTRFRAVTHSDVSRDQIRQAAIAIQDAVSLPSNV